MADKIAFCVDDIPWQDFEINFDLANDIYMLCDWARRFTTYLTDNDVSDALLRGVVGYYQMADMFRLADISAEKYKCMKDDFEESVASVILHTIAALEMVGCDTASWFIDNYECFTFKELGDKIAKDYDKFNIHADILICSSQYFRQLLYYRMKRKNRFDCERLMYFGGMMIIHILRFKNTRNCDIVPGMVRCVSKLLDAEFRNH